MSLRARAFLTHLARTSLLALPLTAHAFSCDMLSMNVDEARSQLSRAARERDLESAKDYARRAKGALEDAAMSAMDCKCQMAHLEFEDAASRARWARDASDGDSFASNLNRSIRAYNAGVASLKACASERRR